MSEPIQTPSTPVEDWRCGLCGLALDEKVEYVFERGIGYRHMHRAIGCRSAALHSAEREVLEAAIAFTKPHRLETHYDIEGALLDATRNYMVLLDGKAEGKEA